MSEAPPPAPHQVTVEARAHGWRIDHYLSRLFPNFSRVLFQTAISEQAILLNGLPVKPSRRLCVNDVLTLVRWPRSPDSSLPPEDIPLDVLFEDEFLIVIDKPAGMITHPGKGNYRGTLAGALQFHFDRLSDIAGKLRPGIVHRLDRDTSGVLVIAKDNQVHQFLSKQFENREVYKEYRAIVWGEMDFDRDVIDTFLCVDSRNREKMMICSEGGNARRAVTHYEVLTRFNGFTSVKLMPQTGRTHQLRVHLQHLGHSIVADRVYGGRAVLSRSDLSEVALPESSKQEHETSDAESGDVLISRQALHAYRLEFLHPQSGKKLAFEAPLREDMQQTLAALESLRSKSHKSPSKHSPPQS
ncbi:MAG: RluA family pseudouridine synthase [Planctomycetota bacterium]|nr:RluA family pseudouridine synthase [Planctomycetota bacterium]MDA1215123.1 RluA family pseudouridine synthase [Planctomycetota bacterium]